MTTSKKKNIQSLLILIGILLVLNVVSGYFFHRFDLTKDKRYTLSTTSLNIIKQVQNPLYVKIYLQGDLPAEFKRLQSETRDLFEEFQAYNKNIIFEFVDPLENEDESMDNIKELYLKGLTPINITVDDKGKQSQEMVFPWAIAVYNNKEVNIPLLKNIMGASTTRKSDWFCATFGIFHCRCHQQNHERQAEKDCHNQRKRRTSRTFHCQIPDASSRKLFARTIYFGFGGQKPNGKFRSFAKIRLGNYCQTNRNFHGC